MSEFDMPPRPAPFEARGGWLIAALAAEFGLTREQSAGLVGNLGFESGGLAILQEIHPIAGRGGRGWPQWTGPRRRAFEAWCRLHGFDPDSDEANYGYLLAELHGDYRHTIDAVKGTKTDADAVFSVGQTYERPYGTTATHLPEFDGRLRYARRALAGALFSTSNEAAKTDMPTPRVLRLTDPPMTGADVVLLQRRLGVIAGAPDGIFGKATEAAVMDFQEAHGLKVDGAVGKLTRAAL